MFYESLECPNYTSVNIEMTALSEIFESQLSGDIDVVVELLNSRDTGSEDASKSSFYLPLADDFPNYHGERSKQSFADMIQSEISARRSVVNLLKQFLALLWGDSNSDIADDFMGTITRQKLKLKTECMDIISSPESLGNKDRPNRSSNNFNVRKEVHDILDFVITASMSISECTTEVKRVLGDVVARTKSDEEATVNQLEQIIEKESSRSCTEYLPNLEKGELSITNYVNLLTLPDDENFGEAPDNRCSQLTLTSGPANLTIKS